MIDKHNRFSSDEARETLHQLEKGNINWHDLFFGKTEVERRRALKNLSLRVPGRPLVRFLYMYFIIRGCLDGRAGFTRCTLQAFYEYLIMLKAWEMKHIPTPSVKTTSDQLPVAREGEILKVASNASNE